MRDVLVALIPTGYVPESVFGTLIHAATIDDKGGVYIWCYGEVHPHLWTKAPEGQAPTCLKCAVAPPRGEWKDNAMLGARGREQMIEGQWSVTLDTETNPYELQQNVGKQKGPSST